MEKRKSHLKHGQPMEQTKCLVCMITTPVSLLANGFDVRSLLHGQTRLAAAVNQICAIHKAMNGCKNSKDSLKDCFKKCKFMRVFAYLQFYS